MDEFLNPLLALLKGVNPLLYVAAVVVLALWGDKLKGLLARFKPRQPDPADDADKWLEEHPLLDRVWKRLKEKFKDKVLTGEVSEDDLYIKLVQAVNAAGEYEDPKFTA